MAEVTRSLKGVPKQEAYAQLQLELDSILQGIEDPVAAMSTLACLLHHGFGFLWTGFYRLAAPDLLRVGPYQGRLGCLEIPVGKGVCGTAALTQRSVLVDDVHQFPGHISCDARSRSEIVVPVFGHSNNLIAVLDIDSEHLSHFDTTDQSGLESLVAWFAKAKVRG